MVEVEEVINSDDLPELPDDMRYELHWQYLELEIKIAKRLIEDLING